jgi:D-3-phosphoglycerate dehydrogenase
MPKVLISDKLSPRAATIFEEHGIDVDVKPGLSPDELKAIIADYDGLAIRSATKVTADILNAATNLKVVGRAGIGVDNVDIAAGNQTRCDRDEYAVWQRRYNRRTCHYLDAVLGAANSRCQ